MKTFEVHNRKTDGSWRVRQPQVSDCSKACEYIAETFHQNWLDLGAIRIDSGETEAEQQAIDRRQQELLGGH